MRSLLILIDSVEYDFSRHVSRSLGEQKNNYLTTSLMDSTKYDTKVTIPILIIERNSIECSLVLKTASNIYHDHEI